MVVKSATKKKLMDLGIAENHAHALADDKKWDDVKILAAGEIAQICETDSEAAAAIKATIDLMEAPAEQIKIRSSYNLAGVSFTPVEIATEIKKHIPNFEMTYNPDFRQAIADSWPSSINDSHAQKDWGWNLEYNLEKMTQDMIVNLEKQYKIKT